MDEKNKRIEESKATKTYEWQNANGTPRAKKDEYSVVTAYYYDSYGNVTSTSVYNDDATDKEYLTTTYDYGTVEEKLRENPKGCIQNGVKKEFYYNEPHLLQIIHWKEVLKRSLHMMNITKELLQFQI